MYILQYILKWCFSFSRTFRGIAYFKQHFYKQATQDLSAAIHLDPNNWLALYYRGCLFRKSNPLKALQDYSISGTLSSTAHTEAFDFEVQQLTFMEWDEMTNVIWSFICNI